MANGKRIPSTSPSTIRRNKNIADLRVEGYNLKEIAGKVGLSFQQVGNIINNDPVAKQVIESGSRIAIALVPIALNNIADALIDKEANALRYKASMDVLRLTGIDPARTGNNVVINNLTMTQVSTLAPDVLSILDKALALPAHSGPIDCKSKVINVTPTKKSE